MKAFHGQQAVKDALLAQLQAHYEADEIIKGQYWENGKGCAVGCTIHSSDHSKYEPLFGIPQVLAYLEDAIFELLPNHLAKTWPISFIKAIKPGADLTTVWPKFAVFLLIDPIYGVLNYTKINAHKSIIQKIAGLYIESDEKRKPVELALVWAEAEYAVRTTTTVNMSDFLSMHTAYHVVNVFLESEHGARYAADSAARACPDEMYTHHITAQVKKLLQLLNAC